MLGARGQERSWETPLFSCTLSPKQKGRSVLTPAERVVNGKRVLERSGGGSAALEPPRRSGRVEGWPWLMHHRSDAKPLSEGQSAGGMTRCCVYFVPVPPRTYFMPSGTSDGDGQKLLSWRFWMCRP